jgi:hypothetical protein
LRAADAHAVRAVGSTRPQIRAWIVRLVPLVLALAVYSWAYFAGGNRLSTGDEPHYLLESWNLVDHADRNLAEAYARYMPPQVDRHAFPYTSPKVLISVHNVGLPLVLVPAALVKRDVRLQIPSFSAKTDGSDSRPARLELILIAALAAFVLLQILKQLQFARGFFLYAAWATAAFSAPIVLFSSQIFPEVPAALLVLLSVWALLSLRPDRQRILLAALPPALLPWLHVRYAILTAALVGALAVRATTLTRPHKGARSLARPLVLAMGPSILSLIVMSIAFDDWYGSPWLNAPYLAAGQHADIHYDVQYMYRHTFGYLFSPASGWLPLAPAGILSLSGIGYLCWRYGRWAIYASLAAASYVVLVGTGDQGASFPARFLIPVLLLAAIPLLAVIANVRPARVAFWPLAALTFALTIDSVKHAHFLYTQNGAMNHLPLVIKEHKLWPDLLALPTQTYPEKALTVSWILGLAFLGWLLIRARDRPQRVSTSLCNSR